MKKFKRSVAGVLSLAVIVSCLSLAGCGGGGTVSKDKSDGGDGTAFSGIEDYAGSTVKFATWVDHTKGEGSVPMASFAEKYDIQVKIEQTTEKDYATKLAGMVAAGQSPDVIVDNADFPYLIPYAEDLSTVKSINLEDKFWDPAVTELGTVNGKSYFVNSKNSPWTYRYMCFYNIKLFEDNGFTSPGEYYEDDNWNIETFVDCATRVRSLGEEYIGASVRPEFATAMWGTNTIKYEDGKFVSGLADSDLSTALKWALSNEEKGIFSTVREVDRFSKNKLGMFLFGDTGLRASADFGTMDPSILGFVPLPKVNKDDEYYPAAATLRSYGICKGSKNAEAAGYFLRYFLDFDNYDRSNMFLSDEASKFYDELREMEDECFVIHNTDYVEHEADKENGTIVEQSSAQIDTYLKSLEKRVDARIKKDTEDLK